MMRFPHLLTALLAVSAGVARAAGDNTCAWTTTAPIIDG
jgi:hypothetical protein